MSKKTINSSAKNLEKTIMAKVKSGKITMKPRWYFIVGSLLISTGLIGFSIGAIFLTNLSFFLLRQHGPMGEYRLQLMLNSFSWWIPILAIIGIAGGVWLLKKYDFSYKKNFGLIVLGFVFSIVIAAFIIDLSGLNNIWSRKGPMRGFYQRLESQESSFPLGRGNGQGRRNESWR
jgi:hypothetical protein